MDLTFSLSGLDIEDQELDNLSGLAAVRLAASSYGFDAVAVEGAIAFTFLSTAGYEIVKFGILQLYRAINKKISDDGSGVIILELNGVRFPIKDRKTLEFAINEIEQLAALKNNEA